jgi:tRNA pseudouridine13 synthase
MTSIDSTAYSSEIPIRPSPPIRGPGGRCFPRDSIRPPTMPGPRHSRDERRLLRELIYQKGNKRKAFRHINKTMKRFYVSAFQSYVFNRVLASRMPDIDRLLTGDVAYKHDNGACFLVDETASEQSRCDAFEISPTGPIFGLHMKSPEAEAGQIERAIVQAEAGEILAHPAVLKSENIKGARRPLRMAPANASIDSGTDAQGDYLELRFDLPSGAYATVLVREFVKQDVT